MNDTGDRTGQNEEFGGCPTCGAGPDRIVSKPDYAKPMFQSHYCGACGSVLLAEGKTA